MPTPSSACTLLVLAHLLSCKARLTGRPEEARMHENSSTPRSDSTATWHTMTLWCPATGCGGHMTVDAVMASLEGTGLEALRCPTCGHRGFRAKEGIQILFGVRHEHVCAYGPSRLTITVVSSGAALVRFGKSGLSPSQLAVYAASWALLCGQLAGTVHLLLESPALSSCYAHFLRQTHGVQPAQTPCREQAPIDRRPGSTGGLAP